MSIFRSITSGECTMDGSEDTAMNATYLWQLVIIMIIIIIQLVTSVYPG